MAIKPTKLRAVFLLLLFILLFISSNSLITEVKAESLEESFKNTPLPFWENNSTNVNVNHSDFNQTVGFVSGKWLEGWAYRKEHNIIGSSGAGINYQIRINIKYGSGSDSGSIVYCNSHSQTDFDDIRFTDNDGETKLDYWLEEKTDSDDATFWIKIVDNLDSNQIIYVYYGNSGVSSTSNGANTFIYFNDFSSDTLTKTGTSISVSGGELHWDSNTNYGDGEVSIPIIGNVAINSHFNWDLFVDYGMFMVMVTDTFQTGLQLYTDAWGYRLYDDTRLYQILEFAGGVSDGVTYGTSPTLDTDYWSQITYDGTNIDLDLYTDYWINTLDTQISISHTSNLDIDVLNFATRNIASHDGEMNYLFIRKFTATEPSHGIWGSEISEDKILSVAIPIQQFKNQKFEFMIDTDNLNESTQLEFGIFQSYDSMNYNFSLEDNIFTQRTFTFNYTEYNYLRFKLDLKYSTNYYKLDCYDENNTKIFNNIIFEYVRKMGNQFIISSNNFAGWFHLYYFTGTVDYSTTWTETIIDAEPNIDTNLLSASALGDNMLNDYEIIYNRYITNFQFLRTNIFYYTEFSQSLLKYTGLIIDTQFYYPNGTAFYRINAQIDRVYNDMRFYVRIYETIDEIESQIFLSACGSEAGVAEMDGDLKFAIWRTQDNHLGMFFVAGTLFNDNILGNPRFISNKTLENFQANITMTYFSEYHATGYRNFILELDGFELGYGDIDGVAEPHFSTTWWDSIPLLGPIINAFMLVGSAIILAIESGLSPITIFLDSIFGAIGGIAGTVWVLFEGSLSDLGISIDAIASDIFGFFDAILTGISDTIADVYTTITDISDNFVVWVGSGITNVLIPLLIGGMEDFIDTLFALWEYQLNLVGTALGWGDVGTFLFGFTESVALTIPSWLAFIISVNVMMVDILLFANAMYVEYGPAFLLYGGLFVVIDIVGAIVTLDLDKIGECLGKYIKVVIWVAEFLLNIISIVLNAIWGILPF